MEQNAPIPYEFKTKPFAHQREEFEASRDLEARAIFWEQGTGKSKLIIDTACWLWRNGKIDAVVVVAPNGVHRNWVDTEIPAHMPDSILRDVHAFHFQSQKAETKWHKAAIRQVTNHRGFAWLTISYEAFMTNTGKRAMIDFFDKRKILYILDEAHYIKSPEAERTKSILRSAKYAPYRRILTGTPIAVGPFDVYTEIEFLDEGFWDRCEFDTYTAFKTHFGIWRRGWNPTAWNPQTKKKDGAAFDSLVGFHRLDELHDLLKPIASRVTKDDVLDLPPKLYTKRYFTMTAEQAKLYKQMRDEFMVWIDLGGMEKDVAAIAPDDAALCRSCLGQKEIVMDGFIYPCPDCAGVAVAPEGDTVVAAMLVMVRLLRLQQITCGYLPTDDEAEPMYMIPGPNRRLIELCDEIERRAHKTIVWARFQLDITLIIDELTRRGIRAVRYDGLVNDEGRAEAKALFQGERTLLSKGQVVGREEVPPEEQAMVFVGNPAAGATGLTLTAARFVDYYSNSFKLIDRLQSEDRAHRIGQENQVLYTDWMAEGTIDEKLVESFRNKFTIASQITGDRLKEWL